MRKSRLSPANFCLVAESNQNLQNFLLVVALDFEYVVFERAARTTLGFELFQQSVEGFGSRLETRNHRHSFALASSAAGLYAQVLLIGRQVGHGSL